VRALRIATDIGRNSTIVSIYQAGESLYEIFDKVCVIYEGRMAYYGPADQARQYFIDMGYEPANRQTTADFLVAVTDTHGRIPKKVEGVTQTQPVPHTAVEFEAYYRESEIRKVNREDMEGYRGEYVDQPMKATAFKESANAEHARNTRDRVCTRPCAFFSLLRPNGFVQSPYTISIPMQVRAVMVRRVQIIKGNWTAQAISTTLVYSILWFPFFARLTLY